MNTQKFLIFLGAAVAAALLIQRLRTSSQTKSGTPKADRSQVVALVEETLQEHQGEASSVVQAFEAALALETAAGKP